MFRDGRVTDAARRGAVRRRPGAARGHPHRRRAAGSARRPAADAAQAGRLHLFDQGSRAAWSTTCCRRASACVRRCCRRVGRLDRDTCGLLLMTDDGALLHRIVVAEDAAWPRSTRRRWPATCAATRPRSSPAARCCWRRRRRRWRRRSSKSSGRAHARLTLTEGRYHQVRRMFAAVGNHVRRAASRVASAGSISAICPRASGACWTKATARACFLRRVELPRRASFWWSAFERRRGVAGRHHDSPPVQRRPGA